MSNVTLFTSAGITKSRNWGHENCYDLFRVQILVLECAFTSLIGDRRSPVGIPYVSYLAVPYMKPPNTEIGEVWRIVCVPSATWKIDPEMESFD